MTDSDGKKRPSKNGVERYRLKRDKSAQAQNTNKDYEVGYGKPPTQTQFKKGQSGNPKGRPKGTKNLKTDFDEELAEQIVIKENGISRKISKQRVIVKSLIAKAAKGDTAAAAKVFELQNRVSGADTAHDGEQDISANDKAILEEFLTRHSSPANVAGSSEADFSTENDDPAST